MVRSDSEAVQVGTSMLAPLIVMLCRAGAGQASSAEYPALVVQQKSVLPIVAVGAQQCLECKRQAC